MNDRTHGDTSAEGDDLAFRAKKHWHRITAPFTDDDYDLPFPALIAGISAVAAIFFLVCWLHITSKITAIYFGDFTVAADNAARQLLSHCFT